MFSDELMGFAKLSDGHSVVVCRQGLPTWEKPILAFCFSGFNVHMGRFIAFSGVKEEAVSPEA